MNRIAELQKVLQHTNAEISNLDKAISSDPDSYALMAMRDSLDKRLKDLETEFLIESDKMGLDVCNYRMFVENGNPNVHSFASTLDQFQKLVSTIFSAIKKGGPKQRPTVSADEVYLTEFNLGYTYPGSVGFALTINNERFLGIESDLDESIEILFEMSQLDSVDQVNRFVKKLGAGPVRAFYNWVANNAKLGLGADIDWRRGNDVRSEVLVQSYQFELISKVLSSTGEETEVDIEVTGRLTAVNMHSKSFRLEVEDSDDIHGKFDSAIDDAHQVTLPNTYRAFLTKTSVTKYSQEEDEITYWLKKIEPV